MPSPPAEPPCTQIVDRIRHRYEDINRPLENRGTISAVARWLNLDRKTVRHFRDTGLDESLTSARAPPNSPAWSATSAGSGQVA
ncbi:hypothetical protein ACWC3X_16140 [Streptomyces populi]|jgi:hypothetical protein